MCINNYSLYMCIVDAFCENANCHRTSIIMLSVTFDFNRVLSDLKHLAWIILNHPHLLNHCVYMDDYLGL
jgi:hypothetical protein